MPASPTIGSTIIGTRKSLLHPGAEDRAIHAGIEGMRGIDRPLPIIHGGRVVAIARGQARGPDVSYWLPSHPVPVRQWTGFDYGELKAAIAAGRLHRGVFSKNTIPNLTTGSWIDTWAVAGAPLGSFAGAAYTARQMDDTVAGGIWDGGNQAPLTKFLVNGQFNAAGSSSAGNVCILVYDRVLTYESCGWPILSQAMTNGVAAQRYVAAGMPGLKCSVIVQTLIDATAATLDELTYVDQDGNAATMPTTLPVEHGVSLVATGMTAPCFSTAPASTWSPYLPLAAGDSGMRSITSHTWNASAALATGTLTYVLGYPIAMIVGNPPLVGASVEVETLGERLTISRVYDGAHLAMMIRSTGGGTNTLFGSMQFVAN